MPAVAPRDLGTTLLERLGGFAGFLRANGFGVGPADAVDVVNAAARVSVLEAAALRWTLKALLCARREEWSRFDALFDAYFLPPNQRTVVEGARPGTPSHAAVSDDAALPSAGEPAGGADESGQTRHGASREETLASTDFSKLERTTEARELERLMRRFARRLKHIMLRRMGRADPGARVDLRRTLRASIATGGTPFALAWRGRRRTRPRLILLLDVSRSMSAYSFFYLRLARALGNELADVHSFVFHTRITSVGEALRDPEPWRARERLDALAAGWAGGTRIGECLQDFNRGRGARLVHSRTGIVIVSDGYDTSDPEVLVAALATLERRARRLVWLHPLLEQPGFEPIARGMQAAIPHLDLLAPGGNLAAIERALPRLLATLG